MDYEKRFHFDKDERMWIFTSNDFPGLVLRGTDIDELIERADREAKNISENK